MSVATKVAEFIAGCPFLEEFEQMFPIVNVDLLGEDATAYSLELAPADPIVRRYTNGDTIRQMVFSLCSREWYGEESNKDTAEFYEKFSDWLDECTEQGRLPALSGNLTSKSIQATTGGYLYDNEGTQCQYRIQCRFLYYKRR